MDKWLTELRNNGQEDMTLMLIGNKTDLRMREVRSEDAGSYAERENMAFLETSALDSTNVNMAFECIIKGKWRGTMGCCLSDVLYVLEIYK